MLIDLRRHRTLWEDVSDALMPVAGEKGSRLDSDNVKRGLRSRRRVRG